MSSAKKAIYLKVNRREEYTFFNLKKWLDISEYLDSDTFVICDNQELQEDIFLRTNFAQDDLQFIQSLQTKDIERISRSIANDYWQNAAHAHLTTFFHAMENGYENFWNIDADDTLFCLETARCAEALEEVQKYCEENEINCMSLDMWHSLKKGTHWSFGVTYSRDSFFLCEAILKHCFDDEYKEFMNENYNIDCFFTYMRRKKIAKIETYYFENMEFVHYGNNMITQPTISWYCRWHDGKLYYPIIYSCLRMEDFGIIPIHDEVVCLDIGIMPDEVRGFWVGHIESVNIYTRDEWENSLGNEYVEKRRRLFVKKNRQFVKNCSDRAIENLQIENVNEKQVVIWGCGELFHKMLPEIVKFAKIQYVCDNNPQKWGAIVGNGITCISPKQLVEVGDVFVLICVEKASVCLSIVNSLLQMGITGFEHIDNWFEFLER